MIRACLAALAVLLALPAIAATPELTPGERAQLKQNLDRGELLYRYDQSAWHVTDAALAAVPDLAASGARGYITTPVPNGLRTTFFGEGPAGYFAVYSAVWTGSSIADATLHPVDARPLVTGEERRLIDARDVALEVVPGLAMCSPASPNVIVVPALDAAELVHVYILTPQTDLDKFPFGGHHRIDVRDSKIVAQRAFTKSCITMERPTSPNNTETVGLYITHLLDPVPTEIHVMNVFAVGIPVFVMTGEKKIFAVEVSGGQPRARILDPSQLPGN